MVRAGCWIDVRLMGAGMEGRLKLARRHYDAAGYEVRNRSYGVGPRFTGADPDGILDVQNENLAIADAPRFR